MKKENHQKTVKDKGKGRQRETGRVQEKEITVSMKMKVKTEENYNARRDELKNLPHVNDSVVIVCSQLNDTNLWLVPQMLSKIWLQGFHCQNTTLSLSWRTYSRRSEAFRYFDSSRPLIRDMQLTGASFE